MPHAIFHQYLFYKNEENHLTFTVDQQLSLSIVFSAFEWYLVRYQNMPWIWLYIKRGNKIKVSKYAFNKLCLKNLWTEGSKTIDKKKLKEERKTKRLFQEKQSKYYKESYDSIQSKLGSIRQSIK